MFRKTLLASAALTVALAAPALAAPPAYDSFSAPIDLGTGAHPADTLYSAVGLGTQAGEPLQAGGKGATAWMTWKPAADGGVMITNCDYGVDAIVRAYTGLAVGQLTLARPATSPIPAQDACTDRFYATKNTTYYIQTDVTGGMGQGKLRVDQDTTSPLAPQFDEAWPNETVGSSVQGRFWSTSADVHAYECTLGSEDERFACAEGATIEGVQPGLRTLKVRAMDKHGNFSGWSSKQWAVLPAPVAETPAPPVPAPSAPTPAPVAPAAPAVVPSVRVAPPVLVGAPSCVAAAKVAAKLKLATARRGVKVAGCSVAYRQKGKRLTGAKAIRRGALQVIVSRGSERRTLATRVS